MRSLPRAHGDRHCRRRCPRRPGRRSRCRRGSRHCRGDNKAGCNRCGCRARHHRVGALAGILGHHVAGIVDDIGVVAGPAGHRVRARAAVDDVVAAVAGERVGEGRAGEVLHPGDRAAVAVAVLDGSGAEIDCPARRHRRCELGDAVAIAVGQVEGARGVQLDRVVATAAVDDCGSAAQVDQVIPAEPVERVARRADQAIARVVAVEGIGEGRPDQAIRYRSSPRHCRSRRSR